MAAKFTSTWTCLPVGNNLYHQSKALTDLWSRATLEVFLSISSVALQMVLGHFCCISCKMKPIPQLEHETIMSSYTLTVPFCHNPPSLSCRPPHTNHWARKLPLTKRGMISASIPHRRGSRRQKSWEVLSSLPRQPPVFVQWFLTSDWFLSNSVGFPVMKCIVDKDTFREFFDLCADSTQVR